MSFSISAARCAGAIIAGLLLIAAPADSFASSFQITPVLLEVDPDKATTTLTIRNSEAKPLSMRVRAQAWTQQEGADARSDTNDIVISPAIVTIAPGGTQILRLGPRNRMAAQERSYRIIVEEIPNAGFAPGTVTMALRLDVPMHVLVKSSDNPQMQWRGFRTAAGHVTIEAVNPAVSRRDLSSIAWVSGSGAPVPVPGRAGSVLAKSSKRWALTGPSLPAAGEPLTLIVWTASGESTINIPVQQL